MKGCYKSPRDIILKLTRTALARVKQNEGRISEDAFKMSCSYKLCLL